MNITLSPKIQELIQEMVDRGDYAAPDEVVDKAFLLLVEDNRRLQRLRELINEGIRDAEAGKVKRWTPELRDEIRRRADELVAKGEIPESDVWP